MPSPYQKTDKRPSILYVDAFDSFSNNIVGLLEQQLAAHVTVVRIDDKEAACNLNRLVRAFDAVVVGPGPGHPVIPQDIGFINDLWKLQTEHILPILGICLGFQSLCLSQGAEIKKLRQARHGIVCKVTHRGTDILSDIGELKATQYHSLYANISNTSEGTSEIVWEPTDACSTLRPLAWVVDDVINGPILMMARHTTKPFWGMQFHPESICTSEAGRELISAWWTHAKQWLCVHREERPKTACTTPIGVSSSLRKTSSQIRDKSNGFRLVQEIRFADGPSEPILQWAKYPFNHITTVNIFETICQPHEEVILLDSQGHRSGRFSILGLVLPRKTMKVAYHVPSRMLKYGFARGPTCTTKLDSIDEMWTILQEALDLYEPRGIQRSGSVRPIASHLPSESPFWGGFMGYISYEAGLETIDVPQHVPNNVPDINMAFIHRSIVIDHAKSEVYVQSLLPDDWTWISGMGKTLESLKDLKSELESQKKMVALDDVLAQATVVRPEEQYYRAMVRKCQEFLAAGDSYELCLTDQSEIRLPASISPWSLYKKLRANNPAPFGAFVRLSGAEIVSSSPERFLNWTRDGRCQFRPIKGTVKKGPGMTREWAHAILDSSKERAENLMIVDLIRHDLSGVVRAENTWVSKLMVVEEYETVFQLVSVIEGQLPACDDSQKPDVRGIHVLKASLPPGSMTGAPKKRSCEILRDLEQQPRGIYSGVLGYLDIGGGGDFSVIIRTAVHSKSGHTPEGADACCGKENGNAEIWKVGAGGAVTIQSTDDGEFEEMETKSSSVIASLLGKKV